MALIKFMRSDLPFHVKGMLKIFHQIELRQFMSTLPEAKSRNLTSNLRSNPSALLWLLLILQIEDLFNN